MASERDQARILLSKAANDEALVRKVCSDTDIADELVGFHAQYPLRGAKHRSTPSAAASAAAGHCAT
jgi:hypothetical protein